MTNTPSTELLLRVNGVEAAFGIEFGSDCPRADEGRRSDPYRQANVSYSLVQRKDGHIVRHTLIDCGMGVVPSLLDFENTHGVHVVDEVLITHPHLDHFAGLDWLSMCLLRSGRPEQPQPLPIYASPECWEQGPSRVHHYLAERSEFRALQPGTSVTLGEVALTPFGVNHGPKAPGALGFTIRHGERKIVVTGDFLEVADQNDPLLFDADVLFLDANTWHPAAGVWHQSVLGDLKLIEEWRPKRAYLIHYSGYEDKDFPEDSIHGPMEKGRFKAELQRIAAGRDIQLAEHGIVVGDKIPWPSR
jgi:phosphoribosyl 1,2-cyclic phosphodiesterase